MISNGYAEIPVDAVDDPTKPLREEIDTDALDELMRSMSLHGLLQPIRLRCVGNRFEVITGHRRTEAARRLHWAVIPAIIAPQNDSTLSEVRLHENLHRADLKPSEEARAIEELHEAHGWTLPRIASALGKSVSWVEQRLEIQDWPKGLTELVDAKRVSIGVARVLMQIPDDNTLKYLTLQAAENGATVRQAQAWLASYLQKPWQLPTPEEIQAAKESLQPPPVPLASCGGCDIQLNITQLATWLLCPNCQMQLPELRRIKQ